ncbi:MAG: MFS transporter [Patescibacteria group bacterium]|nr:MFS transporter [Patescibacteria group bacterium]
MTIFIIIFVGLFGFGLILPLLPFGNGFFNPTIQALASENISKEEYGETLGLMQAFGSVGRILGPIIAGELFSFSIDLPFYFSSFMIFILLLLIYKNKL